MVCVLSCPYAGVVFSFVQSLLALCESLIGIMNLSRLPVTDKKEA